MAWPAAVTAAAISGGVQGGLGIFSNITALRTNRLNWERQQLMNNVNWMHYLQDRDYQNAYNSPVSQIQRMRAAGLNPAMMYENGGGFQASSNPNVPEMQASRDIAPSMQGLPTMADVMSAVSSTSQSKLAESQADYYKSLSQTEDMLREERYNALYESNRNLSKQTEEIAERIKSYADNHKLSEAQLEQFKFDRVMEGKRYMLDKQRLSMDSKLTDKQIESLNSDIQKTLAEKKVTQREYQEMIWTYAIRKTGLANSVNLSKAQIDQANATARKLGIESDLDSPMAFTRRKMLGELQGGLIGASAVYSLYDVIDNFGRFVR